MFARLKNIKGPNNPQTKKPLKTQKKLFYKGTEISFQWLSGQIPRQHLVSMLHIVGIHIRSYGSLLVLPVLYV